MNIRYFTELTSINDIDYKINIYDSDFSGTAAEFICNDFNINYQGAGGKMYEPIHGSDISINCHVQDSAFETFINDIVESTEQRFFIEVLKEGDLFWRGLLLQDFIEIEDSSYPYYFNISGTDGIGTLDDVKYKNGAFNYTDKATLIEHLINALSKIGLNPLYGTNDKFILTAIDWFEDSQPTPAYTIDTLQYTRCRHRVFYGLSCLEVLTEICILFNARLYQCEGVFRIVQVDVFRYDSEVNVRNYKKSGDPHSQEEGKEFGIGIDQSTTNFRLTGMVTSFFPPLKKVNKIYKYSQASYDNILSDIGDWTSWTETDYTAKEDMILQFAGAFQPHLTYPSGIPQQMFADFKIEIRVGSYYLTDFYGNLSWSTLSGISGVTQRKTLMITPMLFDLTTPPIEGDGIIYFKFTRLNYLDSVGNTISLPSGYSFTYSRLSLSMKIIDSSINAYADGTYTASAVNNADCTAINKYEQILGDGIYDFSLGALEVNDGLGNWTFSDSWEAQGSTVTYSILQLSAAEQLDGQSLPTKKLNLSILAANMLIDSRITIGTEYFIFNGCNFFAYNNIWTGEFFKVAAWAEPYNVPTPDTLATSIFAQSSRGDNVNQTTAITSTTTSLASGDTITSITVTALSNARINQGDTIHLINPYNNKSLALTVAADYTASSTTISIDSETLTENYPAGSYVVMISKNVLEKIANPRVQEITVDDDYSCDVLDERVDITATDNAVEVTLPDADECTGKTYIVSCSDATYTATVYSDDNINGSTRVTLSLHDVKRFYSNGTTFKMG